MASITSVSAPGGGNHVHIGDVMVPIRDDATSQGINSLQRRMDLIKKKYNTMITTTHKTSGMNYNTINSFSICWRTT